jgi:hypothetical protein
MSCPDILTVNAANVLILTAGQQQPAEADSLRRRRRAETSGQPQLDSNQQPFG